jgi:hypothetical protein
MTWGSRILRATLLRSVELVEMLRPLWRCSFLGPFEFDVSDFRGLESEREKYDYDWSCCEHHVIAFEWCLGVVDFIG